MNVCLVGLLPLCLAGASLSQDSQPTSNAWPPVSIGMEKQEALKKINSCCDVKEMGIQGSSDTAGLLLPKDPKLGDIRGVVYFRSSKVVGIARDVSGSAEPEVYENWMALYRLLTSVTRGEQRLATIRTTTLEVTNGTTRYIKLGFGNGKAVNIEVSNPDPSSKRVQSVVLSECEGTCADW